MIRLSTALALAALSLTSHAYGIQVTSVLTDREDIKTKVGPRLCGDTPPNLQENWKNGIYDAQIEGQTLQSQEHQNIPLAKLTKASRLLADRHYHHGYSSGFCPNGKAWVVTTPGARALHKMNEKAYQLDTKEVATYCREFYLDFAPAEKGPPRKLNLPEDFDGSQKLTITTDLLESGVISLTCLPKENHWQGPVVWYLAPVKKGPRKFVPHTKLLTAQNNLKNPSSNMLQWVNAIRADEKLPPLQELPTTYTKPLKNLVASRSIVHDRLLLKDVQKQLKVRSATFLGENRVKGRQTTDMAWLLWNSPRHRSLLLNEKATHISTQLTPAGSEKLMVIALAKLP